MRKTITYAKGDGIGPEIMDAAIKILKAANADLEYEEVEIGEKAYLSGNTSGIPKEAWDSVLKNRVFLKAPITTPQGGGYKSLNVTLRKTLGLFSNVRPCKTLTPYVQSKHNMDLVIVRENEEDLYAGIEHQQTNEVVQCLKLITRPGSEKIVRYAFEYARAHGRKKVTCLSKDNIMKQTDGLFHQVYDEIGKEYPEIEKEHMIIDIGAARLADTPEHFDVVVTLNLYGDVVSDITAQIAGSVGLAGSSNIGEDFAMFEAIHGSAPDIKGQDIANPSALINASVMMLNYLGQPKVAENIQNAWLCAIEEGIHTKDIYKEGASSKLVGTKEFGEAVVERLGKMPQKLDPVSYQNVTAIELPKYDRKDVRQQDKELVGVDMFVDDAISSPNELAAILQNFDSNELKLSMITNRGVKVWPDGFKETFCTDHWRCRFEPKEGVKINNKDIVNLLGKASEGGVDAIKTENLYTFDGKRSYSLGQGQ